MITTFSTSLSNPLHPHSLQQQQHSQKRKRVEEEQEQEEMMCETPQQQQQQKQTMIPYTPSPQSQFVPSTPQKSTHLSPTQHQRQRMKTDTMCSFCKQIGHSLSSCPQYTPNNNKPLSASKDVWCRCGYGFCDVKTSHSEKNPDRKYLVCPIKRGARCVFWKWYDEIEESDLQPPLSKYPECECRAGVCKKVMETGQTYFICPIKQGHGSCGYRVSESELLNNPSNDEPVNNTSIDPIRQSRHRSLDDFFEGDQTETAVKDLANDLAEASDLLLTTKRMRIADGSENPSPVAVPEIPEGKCGGSPIEEANSQSAGFPEIEFEDDDLASINLASWEAIEAISSRFSTPSRISCQQSLFQKDIVSADASYGIFPSFDPIVSKQKSTLNSQSECIEIAIKSPNQCTQLSPVIEGKLKAVKRDMLIDTQLRLLNALENLDFHEHESMRETAEATFLALNPYGFECEQFSNYVWDFINLAMSMAEIDKSMENSPTLEEHSKFLEEEKVRLANAKDDCIKTEALLQSSIQKRNLLSEEVSRLEAVLCEKQNELKFCDSETMKVETQLGDIKRRMSTIEDRVRQAEAAKKKVAERNTKQIAAKTALEKAKHAMGN